MKTVFLQIAKSSHEVIDLGDGLYVRKEDTFRSTNPVHETKDDAQYAVFLSRVRTGTPVKNFKGSKYYKMYMERAQKENPELLI